VYQQREFKHHFCYSLHFTNKAKSDKTEYAKTIIIIIIINDDNNNNGYRV